MKDTVYYLIQIILIVAFIVGVAIGVAKCTKERDEKVWNNGYCECGGQFEYEQAVGHQYHTSYIYKCSSCGKRIEVREAR